MLTVNLEKQLMKQNKKVLLPEALLAVKEYERLGDDVCESEVLARVGLNRVVREGKTIKSHEEKIGRRLARFNQERVFHLSQIESLCKKYHLKFLYPSYFRGSVDASLAAKISTFEVAYNVTCNDCNTKIAAPQSSFELEKRPKDPLFFYNLGNGFWYLVHKWGNDISVFRRTYSLLSNGLVSWVLACLLPCVLCFNFFGVFEIVNGHKEPTISCILAIIYLTVFTGWDALIWINGDVAIRLVKKNDWESKYND